MCAGRGAKRVALAAWLLAAAQVSKAMRTSTTTAERPSWKFVRTPAPAEASDRSPKRRLQNSSRLLSRHASRLALPAVALLSPSLASASVEALQPIAVANVDASLAQGFVQATSLIFLSEIGDKTFFIASILAARASRIFTFFGAFSALGIMTVISVVIGQIFHSVPDSLTGGLPLDDYVAIASFVYFGLKSIADALAADQGGPDGLEEERKSAEEELAKGDVLERTRGKALAVAAQAFTLTVAAEIGDRSQISTIALSAAQNPYVVAAGATAGHGVATGIAVLGGGLISKYVSEKGISLIAGVLFLVFAVTTALGVF